jgi:hypothetical protein
VYLELFDGVESLVLLFLSKERVFKLPVVAS